MSTQAVGVFDSGIGGLSVLRALRAELPSEDFVYLSDSGHAPYGERDAAHVVDRSFAIARHLIAQHHVKGLVVACNTATAAAIHLLRQEWPQLPVIGLEPALKPAAQRTRTRRVGVMATRGTLVSSKFRALLDSLAGQAEFVVQACDGLADAIERDDAVRSTALCRDYVGRMGTFGTDAGQIDHVVLGCTHYPFVAPTLSEFLGPSVMLIESGEPVARQTRRKLEEHHLHAAPRAGTVQLRTTGEAQALRDHALRWLQLDAPVETLSLR